jgi:integrase
MKHEKNLKLIDGKWTVDIEVKGKRLRRSFPTKAEAEIALAVLRNQRAMQRLGIEVPEAKSHDLIFADFAEKVLAGLGATRFETRKSRRVCLNALLASKIFDGKRLGEITSEDVANYHTARAEKKPSANAELGFLKMVFKRAVEWGELTRNPADPVKPFRIAATKLRILTDAEVALLLNAASPTLVPVLRVLLTTGMRPHEVFALRWEHDGWDTERGLCTSILALGKKVIFVPGLLAKNHKDREVPLSPELVEMFGALPRDPKLEGKVFPWGDCPPAFTEAVKAAKLKNVTLYTLKHTAASRMIRAGVDIVTVSEILGHSDIKMTMIYCHSDGQSKRDAVEWVSRIYFQSAPAVDAPAAAQPEGQAQADKTVN